MSPCSRMSWDIRSWMPASAAPGRWLSPRPILSLYLQPPEYIKTLYLFHLYVNAPSRGFLLLFSRRCGECPAICSRFSLRATRFCWNVMWEISRRRRNVVLRPRKVTQKPSVTHQVSACGFLITSAAFYCQYLWGFILLDVLYSAVVNCMAALYGPCPWSFKQ